MRHDGTAANKAAAIGPASDATKCMSIDVHNAETFAAGDIINLSDQGGDFTDASGFNIPSSGLSGSPIEYIGIGDVVITNNRDGLINLLGESYLSFMNLSLVDIREDLFGAVIKTTASSNITFDSINLSGDGFGIIASGNVISWEIKDCTITSVNDTIRFAGAANSDVMITDLTCISGGVLRVGNMSGLVCTRLIIQNSNDFGIKLTSVTNSSFTSCTVRDCVTASFVIASGSNITFTDCAASAGTAATGFRIDGGSNFNFIRCTVSECTGNGFGVEGSTFDVDYLNCIASDGEADGFSVEGTAHDISYTNCISDGNGNKSSTSRGDGFTAHNTNYNIDYHYCITVGNTASGFGLVGATSGNVYNCVCYNNGGDWTGEGGLDQNRGGIYLPVTGDNPTTGYSWIIKNCIFFNNYPVEYHVEGVGKDLIEADYNCYYPLDNEEMATLNGLGTKISWDTYHALYESNSFNDDPKFINVNPSFGNDFHLQSTSPCIDTGIDVGLISDFDGNPIVGNVDVGSYEFQYIIPVPVPTLVTDVSNDLFLTSPTIAATGIFINSDGTVENYSSTSIQKEIIQDGNNFTNKSILNFQGTTTIILDTIYPLRTYLDVTTSIKNKIFVGKPAFDDDSTNMEEIRYTVNGKKPSLSSRIYKKPLVFKQNTAGSDGVVLKHAVYYKGKESVVSTIEFTINKRRDRDIYEYNELQN